MLGFKAEILWEGWGHWRSGAMEGRGLEGWRTGGAEDWRGGGLGVGWGTEGGVC